MKVITDIYLILEIHLTVKIFSQDITEDVNKYIAETRPGFSTGGFKGVCYEVAEEFRVKWEDEHDLNGRTFARIRIRMD